jgi:hypothetical protein
MMIAAAASEWKRNAIAPTRERPISAPAARRWSKFPTLRRRKARPLSGETTTRTSRPPSDGCGRPLPAGLVAPRLWPFGSVARRADVTGCHSLGTRAPSTRTVCCTRGTPAKRCQETAMTRSARYKIHPAIGVARVGNAPESVCSRQSWACHPPQESLRRGRPMWPVRDATVLRKR